MENKGMSRRLLDKLAGKTKVDGDQLMQVAQTFKKEDLQSEEKIRQLIKMVSMMSGFDITKEKEDEILTMIQDGTFNPNEIQSMLERMK
ncbi:stage VI sporulation protein F [Brevibacillus daliensis]|uniref:stage VI sporulation protein F n=1 Tax=Brevibacillus daliensis TaxID=2892995 RepID=UPI001E456FFD|nr:stage VI sporulation protein F [Brevibacillus daliensis]